MAAVLISRAAIILAASRSIISLSGISAKAIHAADDISIKCTLPANHSTFGKFCYHILTLKAINYHQQSLFRGGRAI